MYPEKIRCVRTAALPAGVSSCFCGFAAIYLPSPGSGPPHAQGDVVLCFSYCKLPPFRFSFPFSQLVLQEPLPLAHNYAPHPIDSVLFYPILSYPQRGTTHRYFNESSPPTRTLALDGTAPVAATFIATPAGSAPGRDKAVAAGENTEGTGTGTGVLHVNLQSCSSTDRSASDGVLHVLAFAAGDDDGEGLDDGNSGTGGGLGDDGSSGAGAGAGAGAGSGVLVPDILELTYAYGFRETYEAIVTASSESGFAAGGAGPDKDDAKSASVARALRGRAAHTLLAVADGDGDDDVGDSPDSPQPKRRKGEAVSPTSGSEVALRESGTPGDSLRYGG